MLWPLALGENAVSGSTAVVECHTLGGQDGSAATAGVFFGGYVPGNPPLKSSPTVSTIVGSGKLSIQGAEWPTRILVWCWQYFLGGGG